MGFPLSLDTFTELLYNIQYQIKTRSTGIMDLKKEIAEYLTYCEKQKN